MMAADVTRLVERYRLIGRARMFDLPIYNARLEVEALGFRDFGGHAVGVLITPWFMNLIVLPGNAEAADCAPGSVIEWSLPAGDQALNVCGDDALGTYLSAVLFRSMNHFTDQATARAVAHEVLQRLFHPAAPQPAERAGQAAAGESSVSRRQLFSGLGGT